MYPINDLARTFFKWLIRYSWASKIQNKKQMQYVYEDIRATTSPEILAKCVNLQFAPF